jgi:hypothetical protein
MPTPACIVYSHIVTWPAIGQEEKKMLIMQRKKIKIPLKWRSFLSNTKRAEHFWSTVKLGSELSRVWKQAQIQAVSTKSLEKNVTFTNMWIYPTFTNWSKWDDSYYLILMSLHFRLACYSHQLHIKIHACNVAVKSVTSNSIFRITQ